MGPDPTNSQRITATTRPQRPAERDGVDYIFLSDDEFAHMKDSGEFLECAQVYSRWYGVPRSQVTVGFDAGKDVILKVDVQGAETVRRLVPEAVFIFMVQDSLDELRDRLSLRMTESSPEMELRLNTAKEEMAMVEIFDYRVVNQDGALERAIADIDAIIAAEKCRVTPRTINFT